MWSLQSINFGYKFSKKFATAIENENYLYNISNLPKNKIKERNHYNELAEKLELYGASKELDIDKYGTIIFDNKELGNTYFAPQIGICINYDTLKHICKKLLRKGK